MGKTFRKIGGNGNFKIIIFDSNTSDNPLEVFKPPPPMINKNNAWVIEPNVKYTHNAHEKPVKYTQTNPIIHPANYTQTTRHPMNSDKHTQRNSTDMQTNPIDLSSKYTRKPDHIDTKTDIIPHSLNNTHNT